MEELQEASDVEVLGNLAHHDDHRVEEAKVEVVHGGVDVNEVFVASTLGREHTEHLCVCVCVCMCVCVCVCVYVCDECNNVLVKYCT